MRRLDRVQQHRQWLAVAVGVVKKYGDDRGSSLAAQHTMATVWNVPGRSRPGFFPRLGRSVLLLVIVALGVITTIVVSAALAAGGEGVLVRVLGVMLAALLNVGVFLLALRVLTVPAVPTSQLVPGSVLGGAAWTALQLVGGYLVARQLQHTSELYGFFGIVLGLVFWLYLTAQIVVYSSEVNVVVARRLWPRSLSPPPLTAADERTLAALAKSEERRPEQHVDVRFD